MGGATSKDDYVYFIYSEEHIREKNKILEKLHQKFQPGIVVVNGTRKEYSTVETTKTIGSRLYDVQIVAEGIKKEFMYEEPKTVQMKGN